MSLWGKKKEVKTGRRGAIFFSDVATVKMPKPQQISLIYAPASHLNSVTHTERHERGDERKVGVYLTLYTCIKSQIMMNSGKQHLDTCGPRGQTLYHKSVEPEKTQQVVPHLSAPHVVH